MKYSFSHAGTFSRSHEPSISRLRRGVRWQRQKLLGDTAFEGSAPHDLSIARDSKAVSQPPHSKTLRRLGQFRPRPTHFNVLLLATMAVVSASRVFAGDVTLEDNSLLISFDPDTGALTRFEYKNPHWVVERRPELGASFRLFAPLPARRYNPVLGQKQHAEEVRKVSDHEISIRWENLVSENGGVLPMTFSADITLTNGQLTFASTLKNDSDLTVETVEYPYFGDLNPPSRDSSLTACTMKKGDLTPDELYPHFHNEKGYWGVTWPTKMLEPENSHYCLIKAPDMGLGVVASADYRVQYVFEQHPGVISGVTALVPPEDEISGIPVHLEFRVCHFVFASPHSTTTLAPTVMDKLSPGN